MNRRIHGFRLRQGMVRQARFRSANGRTCRVEFQPFVLVLLAILLGVARGQAAAVAGVADPGSSRDPAASEPGSPTPATRDRAAVERIYYEHRLGTKPPFEQTLPPAQIEKSVKLDLKKEALLKRIYKIEIGTAEVDAEVQRINSTTRAPEMLAEIKNALGNDEKRFADTMARPILVERELRQKFENDSKLHAPQRAQAEEIRKKVLAAKDPGKRIALLKENRNVNEVTWQLSTRPASTVAGVGDPGPGSAIPATKQPTKAEAKSPSYSIEATTQIAQQLSTINNASPASNQPSTSLYFEDLDPELQRVLRAQLQKTGDVSAVIETSGGFLLFVAKKKQTRR